MLQCVGKIVEGQRGWIVSDVHTADHVHLGANLGVISVPLRNCTRVNSAQNTNSIR